MYHFFMNLLASSCVCCLLLLFPLHSSQASISQHEFSSSKLYLVPVPSSIPFTNVTTLNFSDLPRKAHLVTTTEPWNVVVPSPYPHLERTSVQAKKHHCKLATNGGPFQVDGSCVGAVIVNGNVIANDFGGTGFGITTTRGPQSSSWVIGTIDTVQQAQDLGIQHYVTGFDWLVEYGENVVVDNNTGGKEAPRTAIGVDHQGRLLLMVADGCEHWYDKVTVLYELLYTLLTILFVIFSIV